MIKLAALKPDMVITNFSWVQPCNLGESCSPEFQYQGSYIVNTGYEEETNGIRQHLGIVFCY